MTSELTKALVAFHQNVGTIHKTARSFQNQYAPLDEVLSVVVAAPKSVVSMDWQNRALSAYWVENGRSEEVEMICDQLESLLEAHA